MSAAQAPANGHQGIRQRANRDTAHTHELTHIHTLQRASETKPVHLSNLPRDRYGDPQQFRKYSVLPEKKNCLTTPKNNTRSLHWIDSDIQIPFIERLM